jgi:hypothetical protein
MNWKQKYPFIKSWLKRIICLLARQVKIVPFPSTPSPPVILTPNEFPPVILSNAKNPFFPLPAPRNLGEVEGEESVFLSVKTGSSLYQKHSLFHF